MSFPNDPASFPKESAFGQADKTRAAKLFEVLASPDEHVAEEKEPPYEHWHHDLVAVDVFLDQKPPEVERARSLLLEVADEIHAQFETMRGSRWEK